MKTTFNPKEVTSLLTANAARAKTNDFIDRLLHEKIVSLNEMINHASSEGRDCVVFNIPIQLYPDFMEILGVHGYEVNIQESTHQENTLDISW